MRRTLILAFNLVGIFDAGYLLWVYTSPTSPMICLGGGTGCDTVRASSYANLLGVPLPAYGVLMYVTLGTLIFAESLVPARVANLIRYTIAGISGFGFIFSLYLTGIEAFVLHAWCTWCMISTLCVTLIFALAAWLVVRPGVALEPSGALVQVRRQLAVFIAALVVGTPSFYFLTRSAEVPPPPPAPTETLLARLVRPDSHWTGNEQASVSLIEFGDFECAPCGRAEPVLREIRRKYGQRIRFIFRHFPIERIHPRSFTAAVASECAAEQGKFWEAAAKLYENQHDLREQALVRYAAELGLNVDRFRQCLASGATAGRVTRDLEDAIALGLRATPTFIMGRRLIEGSLPLAEFSRLIEQELATAETSPPQPLLARQRPPVANQPRKDEPPAPASNTPLQTRLTSARPFGAISGELFSEIQSSATTCREDEAAAIEVTLIGTPEARELFLRGSENLFVDVRSVRDFAGGHIPRSINLPAEEIEQRWNELPKDRSLILYESGESPADVCALSRNVARYLLARGFSPARVKVYQDGLAGWRQAGLPIEP